MGLLWKIIPDLPGGPGHIAYSVLKKFNLFISATPSADFEDAAKYVLKSRKSTYKKTTDEEIEFFLKFSGRLGDLVTIIIYLDDPTYFSINNRHATVSSIRRVYRKYIPSEIDSFSKIDFLLRRICERRSKHKIDITYLSFIIDRLVCAFNENDFYDIENIERIIKYTSKVYLASSETRDVATNIIQHLMDSEINSATKLILPLINNNVSAGLHIDAGFESLISGKTELAFDELLKAFCIVKRDS